MTYLEIDVMQWTPVERYHEGKAFAFLLLLNRLGVKFEYGDRSADDVMEFYFRQSAMAMMRRDGL